MTHLNEDTLLKLSLDLLEGEEKAAALKHLTECAACREVLGKLKNETTMLGSFQPELPDADYSMPRRRWSGKMWLLRAAALLLIGFVSGFGVSHYNQKECVNVFSYSARGANPTIGDDGLVICESEALEVIIR